MEYTIIISDRTNILIEMVNYYIKNGWSPLGSPYQNGSLVNQAMTKTS